MQMDTTKTLVELLEKTISPDRTELEAIQTYLTEAAQNDFTAFIKILSDVLVHGDNSNVVKMAAGLQLKNHLTSNNPNVKEQYQQRWLALPEDVKLYIKKNILIALQTGNSRPSSAAQCVAYIAVVELPIGQWDDLITTLIANVKEETPDATKEASLEAIEYICKDVDSEVLKERSDQILTCIVNGMRVSQPSNYVRIAAAKALFNILELTKANFENELERDYMMEVLCDASQSTDSTLKLCALQCLVKISSLYYQCMDPYMELALMPLTINAIKSDIDEIAVQGIHFWSSVIQQEINFAREETEATNNGNPPIGISKFYVRHALEYLVPSLVQKLNKDTQTDFELEWSPSKAVAMCLMLLSTCYEDEIVAFVFPFLDSKMKNGNWRYKEAGVFAFDTVYGGVTPETLKFFL